MFLVEILVQMRIFATHKLSVIIAEKDHQSRRNSHCHQKKHVNRHHHRHRRTISRNVRRNRR